MSLFAELSLITLHWFLTSFASVVHIKLLLRIWDLFFYEGSLVLFQVTLGMLSMKVIPNSSPSFIVLQCLILTFRGKNWFCMHLLHVVWECVREDDFLLLQNWRL